MKLFRKLRFLKRFYIPMFLLAAVAWIPVTRGADPWQPSELLRPAQLAKQLSSTKDKPMLIQVGFSTMYKQAHIPGSRYCGPTYKPEGIEQLKKCVEKVSKSQAMVIYCGCCPWEKCPNVRPAFAELKKMGFSNVKVMEIATDFGKNWVSKGYPVASGE